MNVSNGYARIARRSTARFLSKRGTRPPPLGFWVGALSVGALASVAFVLWRVRQDRTSASSTAPAAPGTAELGVNPEVASAQPRSRDLPQRGLPQPELPQPELQAEPGARHDVPSQGGTPYPRPRASSTPSEAASSEPWNVRVAQAITLGSTGELRCIADEMARDGWDSEAGLLRNYALLMERSSASRERVLAEVGRMLEAAGRLRARPAPPKNKPGMTGAASADPAPPSAQAESCVDAPIQPLPMLSIGKAVSA
jgi:hypothetical protein